MTDRYIIVNEETDNCEWEYWKDGEPCSLPGVLAIARTDDLHTEGGFHEGHFCDVHIGPAWKAVTGEDITE